MDIRENIPRRNGFAPITRCRYPLLPYFPVSLPKKRLIFPDCYRFKSPPPLDDSNEHRRRCHLHLPRASSSAGDRPRRLFVGTFSTELPPPPIFLPLKPGPSPQSVPKSPAPQIGFVFPPLSWVHLFAWRQWASRSAVSEHYGDIPEPDHSVKWASAAVRFIWLLLSQPVPTTCLFSDMYLLPASAIKSIFF